jgi:hypothetical protein
MKKIVLADAKNGTVVRVDGNWGVVCVGKPGDTQRIVDFWDDGRRRIPPWTLVDVQTKRIYRKEVAV